MVKISEIKAWRWAGTCNVEVLTDKGWVLYSTGPNVERELAELRAAGIPKW